jgi:hypothetical protein
MYKDCPPIHPAYMVNLLQLISGYTTVDVKYCFYLLNVSYSQISHTVLYIHGTSEDNQTLILFRGAERDVVYLG